jgi:hypothetical protein
MTRGDRERWLDAAVTLAADPSARVPCPACGLEMLRFEAGPAPGRPDDAGAGVERDLVCGFCGEGLGLGRAG